ncbi:MAG TPA: hypothetical protein VM324_12020 [Egibacteraceae bacterium]|nr:hypothetical protein [Egibacteraceae bacterium]
MRSRSAPDRTRLPRLVLAGLTPAALALALLLSTASGTLAGQPDAGAALGIEVEVGFAGRLGQANRVPVTVTVQPGRFVSGTLAVESRTGGGGGVREERDIEVAVGSRNAYRFVLPRGAVVATLDEGAGDPVSVRAPLPRDDGGDFLAGVLGTVPPGPPPLRSEPLATSGSWVGVDPEWAELGPGALQPLSGLVAGGRALAALSEGGLRNVAAAVAAGMDLVVVEPVPAGLDLPWGEVASWTLPAAEVTEEAGDGEVAATVVPAGRGRVATTTAVLGEGVLGRSPALWSALIEPRPGGDDRLDGGMPGTLSAVLGGVTSGVPTLPWLAVFLVAYIVVVGPVNGVVLSRFGRRELAWVTVPAVTAVFTAGGWLGATGSQPPVGYAGAATAWVDGSATETVVAIARAPTAGERRLTLPGDEWEVEPEGAGEPAALRRAGSLRLALDLPALQPGGLVARRPVDDPAPLQVEAAGGPEGVRVTVTNVAAEALSDVAVRAATSSRRIGALRPGEARTVTLEGEHLPVDDWGAGPGSMGMHGGTAVEGPRALEPAVGQLDGNPGLVWAVGTVETSDTGAEVEGRRPLDLGRFVAVGVRAAGTPRAHTVDRALVQTAADAFRPAPLLVEGGGPVVLRYRVPPSGIGAPLRALVDRQVLTPHGDTPELWLWERTERQWRPLDDALPGGTGGPDGYVSPLGEVYVRVTGPLFPLRFSGMGLTVEDGP